MKINKKNQNLLTLYNGMALQSTPTLKNWHAWAYMYLLRNGYTLAFATTYARHICSNL